MYEGQGLGEFFIQPQRPGDCARDLRDLHSVRETAAKVVGVAVSEDLSFAGQPAEGTRVKDARSVSLKRQTVWMRLLRIFPRGEGSGIGNGTCWRQAHQFFAGWRLAASFASRILALSSFFCTLPMSPGSVSA